MMKTRLYTKIQRRLGKKKNIQSVNIIRTSERASGSGLKNVPQACLFITCLHFDLRTPT